MQRRYKHSLMFVFRIVHAHAQKYMVYTQCHSFKLLMVNKPGIEVSINPLDSVLSNAGGVCSAL